MRRRSRGGSRTACWWASGSSRFRGCRNIRRGRIATPRGRQLVNAVARTPESGKAGAALYAKSCSNCHGPNGLGNGRLAAAMAAYGGRPSNLTDSEWQHGSSDGEIFAVIRDGVGPDFHMPKVQRKVDG